MNHMTQSCWLLGFDSLSHSGLSWWSSPCPGFDEELQAAERHILEKVFAEPLAIFHQSGCRGGVSLPISGGVFHFHSLPSEYCFIHVDGMASTNRGVRLPWNVSRSAMLIANVQKLEEG